MPNLKPKSLVVILIVAVPLIAISISSAYVLSIYPGLNISGSTAIALNSNQFSTTGSLSLTISGAGYLVITSITASEDYPSITLSQINFVNEPVTNYHYPLTVNLPVNLSLWVQGLGTQHLLFTLPGFPGSTITVTVQGTWKDGMFNLPVTMTTSAPVQWS